LASIESKADNCRSAILGFEESLRVRAVENAPLPHARALRNLGSTYVVLAEAEEREKKLLKAKELFQEASRLAANFGDPRLHQLQQHDIRELERSLS
jgi:hypothetical protein